MEATNDKINELDVYGDQVKEVLAHPPSRLFVLGNWIVFFFLGVVIFLTWLIKFPDIIVSEVAVSSKNRPIDIVAELDGNMSHLFVENKDSVKTGDQLAIISDEINYDDLMKLEKFLESIKGFNHGAKPVFPKGLRIGELQRTLNNLENTYKESASHSSISPEERDRERITLQLQKLNALSSNIQKQKELYEKHLDIYQSELNRQELLFKNGSISKSDLEKSRISYVDKKRELENINFNQAQNSVSMENLEREYSKLGTNEEQTMESYKLMKQSIISDIKSEITEWKSTHIIYAKQDGILTYLDHFNEKEYINKGTDLFAIVNESNDFIGEGYLSQSKSGKVKIGQQVIVKLMAYPEKEFGYLKGYVDDVSIVPNNDQYLISIRIPEGLVTSYSKKLPFKPKYSGRAEIVTENLRLIERVFYELRGVFQS